MMKRLTAVLLVLAMLLCGTCTVSAEGGVTVTVGEVMGEIGQTVQVPVSVSEGHYLVNARIFLTYDPTVLELQKVCDDEDNPYFEDVNTEIIDSSCMWAFAAPSAGKANFVFVSSSDQGNTAGGTLYTLTFKLLKESYKGAISVTVPEMRRNNGGEDYDAAVTLVNGAVNVFPVDNTPEMRGDVNGDGLVDLLDAIRLLYYTSDLLMITPKQQQNADVNESGTINLNDVLRLFYHISGELEL